MAQRFDPEDVWKPFGAFAMVAVQGNGHIVHLKGQVALDKDGRLVGKGDLRAQLHQILENIGAVLASVGGEMGDIFSLTHYTTDIEAFMQAGDIRAAAFSAPYPVTTTVQVARLYDREVLLEITAIAEVPAERYHPPA